MNLLLRLVLVGSLFQGAYYSTQITQQCGARSNRGRGLIGVQGLIEEIRYQSAMWGDI